MGRISLNDGETSSVANVFIKFFANIGVKKADSISIIDFIFHGPIKNDKFIFPNETN